MNTSDTSIISKRSPLLAAILSFAATGLGHIYCGKIEKGLVLFFISFAFAPVIVTAMETMSSPYSLMAVILSVLVLVSVFVYAIVDSAITARKTATGYRLKEYNRWYIYLLLIVVSFSYPTNLANSIRTNVVQAYKIPSTSMTPGILKGDRLFLNKAVYKTQSPGIGDIVIFTYPDNRHLDYMKRIVAMPGDSIEIRQDRVYINDKPLAYETMGQELKNQVDPGSGTILVEKNGSSQYRILLSVDDPAESTFNRITIPHGFCFVLGDNRHGSKDSRHFGPVPLADIKGRVDFIYFPAGTWSRFGKYRD
ncbi:MAG: signal peptidase I [Pseudomonadota bacterium]